MVTLSLWMRASFDVNYDGRMYSQVPWHLMSVCHSNEHANGQFLVYLSQQWHCDHWHFRIVSVIYLGGGQTICVLGMLSDKIADLSYPRCVIHVLKKTSCSSLFEAPK